MTHALFIQFTVTFSMTCIIHRQLGEKLAELGNILLVTGGFFGVGDTVARNYNERCIESKKTCSVWHVLPEKDCQVGNCFASITYF